MSFAETWITNGERNPDCMLRNADDYYIPAHRVEFVKGSGYRKMRGVGSMATV
jgi:hypothetical protein